MPVTRCEIVDVRARLIGALNSMPAGIWSPTITGSGDSRRNDVELDKIILGADARICAARASKLGDGYRSLFLSLSASILHAGTIPDHLGPIESVMIKYATADSAYQSAKFDESIRRDDIQRWRANVGGRYGPAHDATNSITSGYYVRRGSEIYYTGADLKVQIATFIRSLVCQAPETDENLLLGLALGDSIKEGDQTINEQHPLIINARAEYAVLVQQAELSHSETTVMAA